MFFRQRAAANATLSYLFGCAGHQMAIAVDVVAGDEDWFVAEADRAGARIVHVIDTHVHADHYSGGPELARRVGAPYGLHQSNQGRVAFEFLPLRDGQRLEAGNVLVDVIHTPGHTPDSICLMVRDLRRGDEPWFVITGDTLFVGAVGRPDLAGQEREMAAQLHDTLHQRLLTLPPELEVYPGHQAGSACGAGLSGKPASTIGFEKRFNPMLSMPKPAFVDALTAEIPPAPADMARIVDANLRGVEPEASVALFALLVNLPWEVLQAPLFAGHAEAPYFTVVLSCLQATVGDAAIMLVAHGVASWLAGDRRWLLRPSAADLARFSATGILVTTGIEWLATRGWWVQAWSYSALMPVVPGLGVGLAPLAQWFILPPLVAWLARRHLHGTLAIGRSPPGQG